MKTLFEHIEYVKGQPHHVRKRVALGSALGITVAIGLVWFGGSLAAGSYAIQGSNFAQSTGAEPAANVAATGNNDSQLAGAAAAVESTSTNQPAHIIVEDVATTSTATPPEQTVIPF